MKKIKLHVAAAVALALASCSQDDFAPIQNETENGNVTFTVTLNDKPATRAFGDGLSATTLQYAVYDVTDNNSAFAGEGTASFNGSLSTTVSLNLVNGRDYKVAFFASYASDTDNVYTFNAEGKTVKVDYDKMNQSAEQVTDNDCFFNVVAIGNQDLGKSLSVTLTRPVAQINFGSADLKEAAVTPVFGENGANLHTTVTTKGYTTLNLLDGTVDENSEVEFTTTTPAKPITSQYGSFPVEEEGKNYDYIHCTYVLVPKAEKSVAEVKLTLYKGQNEEDKHDTVTVSNVPLQANYRTNIYGNLLTSKTDITVTKDKEWSGEDYDVKVWDGSIAEVPEANDANEILISTPAQLAGIAKAVNEGNSMAGYTLKLDNDIDLNNIDWTPIGTTDKKFMGSFDGGNFTVSNLSVIKTQDKNPSGLFGYVTESSSGLKNVRIEGVKINVIEAVNVAGAGALVGHAFKSSVSNIYVKDVEIRAHHYGGGVAGYIYGNVDFCQAENVDIELRVNPTSDNKVDNGDKAGAIAGYCAESGSGIYTTNNNTAKNVTIAGLRDVGGLFGMMQYTRSLANNTVENVTVKVNATGAESVLNDIKNFGPIVGRWGKSESGIVPIVGENNTYSNYTFIDKDGNEETTASGTLEPTQSNN